MEKIGLLVRRKIVDELAQCLKTAQGFFFINFKQVDAMAMNTLRNQLHLNNGSRIFVTKNSLLKRTLADLGYNEVNGILDTETGVVLVYDEDVVSTCKLLADFVKDNEKLKLKGGFLAQKMITAGEMTALAKLPSKEILMGMAVRGLASPLTGFLTSLNQVILKFVWVVEEIKNKKG